MTLGVQRLSRNISPSQRYDEPDLGDFHQGLAQELRALNQTIPSPATIAIPGGRAYSTTRQFGFHAGQIHMELIGESAIADDFLGWLNGPAMGGLYMGCGGMVNLSLIASAKSQGAILFDLNPFQTMFWNRIIPLIAAIPDAQTFVSVYRHAETLMSSNLTQIFGDMTIQHNYAHALEPGDKPGRALRAKLDPDDFTNTDVIEYDWLRRGYSHLHDMARAGAIGAVTLDATDAAGWKQIGDVLNKRDLKIDGIYFSNIFLFLSHPFDWSGRPNDGAWQRAIDNMRSVMAPHARIINATPTPQHRARINTALKL